MRAFSCRNSSRLSGWSVGWIDQTREAGINRRRSSRSDAITESKAALLAAVFRKEVGLQFLVDSVSQDQLIAVLRLQSLRADVWSTAAVLRSRQCRSSVELYNARLFSHGYSYALPVVAGCRPCLKTDCPGFPPHHSMLQFRTTHPSSSSSRQAAVRSGCTSQQQRSHRSSTPSLHVWRATLPA